MTPEQITDIERSIPFLERYGLDITNHFYQSLFEKHPALKSVFNMSHQRTGNQPRALASSILAYAKNIRNPDKLLAHIRLIAEKHVSVGVKPEQYSVVGSQLLESICTILNLKPADSIVRAWQVAYQELAEIFIEVEAKIRRRSDSEQDFTSFKILKIVEESPLVRSIYLSPANGKVPQFIPGQYISLKLSASDGNMGLIRQYSLSHPWHPEFLRISVKKEVKGKHRGQGSHAVHSWQEGDMVECSQPCGSFCLSQDQAHKVFLSAGIGITPLLSMALSLETDDYTLIHCDRDQSSVPLLFDSQLSGSVELFLEDATDHGEAHTGYLNLDTVWNKKFDEADFYICGPVPFIKAQVLKLREKGIGEQQIKFEMFASLDESF
ncbi:globin domain-containing protein [Pseudobacteriovorax antillogorgiicola]|uniref:nitric oxide dioxygenase n=1 Tax=Pseudobacteriovorax antillogorgiicola TaxID=1513793 RepID=A0A1Y6CG83_9BACT|nr:globin domain-containing protein [Pseudobacteriovorax antillogorgiicola]TCS47632.1 nitric oxide dioxygenase [Pseudobacteriovorax antillogorgiicola]SMF59963.1 nitric oxide dioxygenase [Pseudobacteriovorax antillogorgiicola]